MPASVAADLRRLLSRSGHRRARPPLPAAGWSASTRPAPVDQLTDEQLGAVNELLPWQCFTVDGRGRRLGQAAWSGKRTDPQLLPDPRIQRLDALLELRNKSVLEIGCFEGVHTTALCDVAAEVTAVDARVENVAKTAVRCALLGVRPRLLVSDIEQEPAGSALWKHDVIHHVGVLYHLVDPWTHLANIARAVGVALMLDTHYALDSEVDEEWAVGGRTLSVRRYAEGGAAEPFSGMYSYARWLRHAELVECLTEAGLTVVVDETRQERNGARVLLIAERR